MEEKLQGVKNSFYTDIEHITSLDELESIRIKYLGKKSVLMTILASLVTLSAEEKRIVGKEGNLLRKEIETTILKRLHQLSSSSTTDLKKILDITEPSHKPYLGKKHIISQMIEEVIEVFGQFGFEYAEGPEIETDWYCFERLNMPPDHPARDLQDTFYLDTKNSLLPRTHTSAVQIRYGESHKPPFRIVVPGRVYRNEAVDARHTFMFHQFEALIVDDTTSVADCKSIITQIARRLLKNEQLEIRFRHAFFPYTEPSFEIDGTCLNCMGKGCRVCSNKGWIELGGLGMVHPQVLLNMNIDPEKYQGFALGFGPERFAMLRHDIKFLPEFFENDLRFNRQF